MIKKFVKVLLGVIFSIFVLTACGTVDKPCMYCNSSPSREYKKSDNTMGYVCENCSSKCMLCGAKATKHYESLIGIVFVCDECYEEVKEQQ